MMKHKMPAKHDVARNPKATITLARKYLDFGRELISSLLFPARCPVCDDLLTPEEAEKGIHPACENKLYPVEGAVCMHCGRPLGQRNPQRVQKAKGKHQKEMGEAWKNEMIESERNMPSYLKIESTREYCQECQHKGYLKASSITQAKSLYIYYGAVKHTMYRFKYANKREYAAFFARKTVQKYSRWLSCIDLIIPVPMYLPKQKKRGYNQAESFAEELSKLTGIPVDKHCIVRVKDTTPQKQLDDKERKNNLENAFQTTKSIVQYRHILVVDDIYTTGYTAQAVAKELKKKGDHQIYILSICIGSVN